MSFGSQESSVFECITFRPEMIEAAYEKEGRERKVQIDLDPGYWFDGSGKFAKILEAFEFYSNAKEALIEKLMELK